MTCDRKESRGNARIVLQLQGDAGYRSRERSSGSQWKTSPPLVVNGCGLHQLDASSCAQRRRQPDSGVKADTHYPYTRPVRTGAFLTPVGIYTGPMYGCRKMHHLATPSRSGWMTTTKMDLL